MAEARSCQCIKIKKKSLAPTCGGDYKMRNLNRCRYITIDEKTEGWFHPWMYLGQLESRVKTSNANVK